jgi:hypothetical protein
MDFDDMFEKYFNEFIKDTEYTFKSIKKKLRKEKPTACLKEIKLIDKFRLKHYWLTEEMICKQFGIKARTIQNLLYYKKNTYDY